MAQNNDWFFNGMLGWLRWIASRVAAMFQTTSSDASRGSNVLDWFSANWITLLLTLIVIGIVVDWIVWMVRWRPYWLWFRKRRVLLDDDIDMELSDEDLQRRYAPPKEKKDNSPHFKGSELGRAGRPLYDPNDALYDEDEIEYDEDSYDEDDYDMPDIEDPYDGAEDLYENPDYDEDDDYQPEPRKQPNRHLRMYVDKDEFDDYDPSEDSYDELYDEEEYDDSDEYDESDYDEEEPDVSFIYGDDEDYEEPPQPREKRKWLPSLKRRKAHDEDPFAVDEELDDPDDDEFFRVVSDVQDEPYYDAEEETHEQDTSVYRTTRQNMEVSEELVPEADWTDALDEDEPVDSIDEQKQPTDWTAALDESGQPLSRKSRREMMRAQEEYDDE